MNDRGSRGRSPLFYEFIKNINGVRLVSPKQDSLDLIKKSIFTSTISGSVALESAIMEKSLYSETHGSITVQMLPLGIMKSILENLLIYLSIVLKNT